MKKDLILIIGTLFLFAACDSSSGDKHDTDGVASDALIDEDMFSDDLVDEDEPVITDTKTDADLPGDKDGVKDDGAPSDDDTVPPVDEDDPVTDDTLTDSIVTDDITTDDIMTDDIMTDEDVIEPISGLFFSEYVHGSNNDKGFELYNASSSAIDLNFCEVRVYKDGTTTADPTIALGDASLATGEVFVVCHTNFSDKTNCDLLYKPGFNGNDALELICNGTTLDVFGQIGFNPGTEWGTDDITTANHTLRRKCGITEGDTDGSDAFAPADEWDGYPLDTLDGLGWHTVECGANDEDSVEPDEDIVEPDELSDELSDTIAGDELLTDEDQLAGPAEMVISQNDTVYPSNGAVFDFGNARIAVDTPTYDFLVENLGGEDLHIDTITLDDTENFILDISSTDTTVAPGGFTTISITFDPTLEGSLASFVTIESDDPAGDYILNIGGTGLPTPVFPILLDNYDGTGDLTYTTDGTWGVNAGNYEGRANSDSAPDHSYASYDLTQSIADWTLDKTRGNEWFGWLKMNRTGNVTGWSVDNFSMAMVLAADSGDFNDNTTKGYAVGFKGDGSLVIFRFDAGITDVDNTLPGTSVELANAGYVYDNNDGGVNVYVELKNGGKWAVYYKKGAQLSDADARDKTKYTDGTVTSATADETYTGIGYKYAGWVYAHNNSASHKALFDNFGAGLTE